MSQTKIEQTVKNAIDQRDSKAVIELLSSAGEKPETATVDKLLKYTVNLKGWDLNWQLVQEICLLDIENKPSEDGIANTLLMLFDARQKETFDAILEKSKTKLNPEIIEGLLDVVLQNTEDFKWGYVESLCFLPSTVKLNQSYRDKVLMSAADNSKSALAARLYQNSDSPPSQDAIDYALKQTWEHFSLGQLRAICEKSVVPPSQKAIESLLDTIISDDSTANCRFIEYLCFSATNKPGQPSIDKALVWASSQNEWELAKKLYTIQGNNAPSESAVAHALQRAWIAGDIQRFKSICEESTTRIGQAAIHNLLLEIENSRDPSSKDYLEHLSLFPSVQTQASIDDALMKAADSKDWYGLRKLYTQENRAPSEDVIASTLMKLFEASQIGIFDEILKNSKTKLGMPSLGILLDSILQSTKDFKWDYLEELCFAPNVIKLDQSYIDKILKNATDCREWMVAERFYTNSANPPSQSAVAYALQQALEANLFDKFTDICRKSVTPPSRESIEALLDEIVNGTNKLNRKYADYLCFSVANKPGRGLIDKVLIWASNLGLWDLANKLYSMQGDHAPSESALIHAFQQAWESNELATFKLMSHTCTARLSEKALEGLFDTILEKGGEDRWAYLEGLCFFSPLNKAQVLIDRALIAAAARKEWACARNFYTRIDKAPGQGAVDLALKKAWEFDNPEEFAAICVDSVTQPSQVAVDELLDALLVSSRDISLGYLDALCSLTGKLGQSSRDRALIWSANLHNWGLAQRLYTLKSYKAPSESAVIHALQRAWESRNLRAFKSICEDSITQLTEQALTSLKKELVANKEPDSLDYLELLCLSPLVQEPSLIDEAISKATASKDWERARKFYTHKTKLPTNRGIGVALQRAWSSKTFVAFKSICEESVLPPTQSRIQDLLLNHLLKDNSPDSWIYIEYLCSLNSTNKPDQIVIDQVLEKALSSQQWERAKKLYTMQGDNKPSREAIEKALDKATEWRHLPTINDLCCLPGDSRPRIEVVGRLYIRAAANDHLDVVETVDAAVMPLSEATLDEAFLTSARNNQDKVFGYLLAKNPKEAKVVEAFELAAKHSRIAVLNVIFNKGKPSAISQPVIDRVLLKAFAAGSWHVCAYFLSPDKGFVFNQQVIDQALLSLVGSPLFTDKLLDCLFQYKPSPSKEGIQQAFAKAEQVKHQQFTVALKRKAGSEVSVSKPVVEKKQVSFEGPKKEEVKTKQQVKTPVQPVPTQTKNTSNALGQKPKAVSRSVNTDSKLRTIFVTNYQPKKDFEQAKGFNSEQRREATLQRIRSEMKVDLAQARQFFTKAYKQWLDQTEIGVRRAHYNAERELGKLMPKLLGLDSKLGLFGGETCLVDGKEIRLAKGASTILKHYQNYKSGEQPSAVVALDRIIRQAYHSDQYQGHWFFNRRQEDVSRFYSDIMRLRPEMKNQMKDEEGPNCGLC